MVNVNTNLTIGHCGVYVTGNSVYLERILIGDKEQRGKGIGQQIVNLLLDFTFSTFNKKEIELNVFDWNIMAIKCYKKVGFFINPAKTLERKINGEVWIALNMKLDKQNWEQQINT